MNEWLAEVVGWWVRVVRRAAGWLTRRRDDQEATRLAVGVVLGVLALFIGGPPVGAAVVYLPLAETFGAVVDWYAQVIGRVVDR